MRRQAAIEPFVMALQSTTIPHLRGDSTVLPSTVLENLAARFRPGGLFLMVLRQDGTVVYHDAGAGVFFERSAVPPAYLSVFSPDYDRLAFSGGAGLHVTPKLRVDVGAAFALPTTIDVSTSEARLPKVSALRVSVPDDETPINAGRYKMSTLTAGLGARYLFQ